MFLPARGLLSMLLFAIIGTVAFFHFHNAFSVLSSFASNSVKLEEAHRTASERYASVVRKNDLPAEAPVLPDISGITVNAIAAKAPAFNAGKVTIADMNNLPGVREFIKKDGRVQRLRLAQMVTTPQVIYVQQGHYDLTHLYETVRRLTLDSVLVKKGDKYLLRMPILVGENASLTISSHDTGELLLSQEQGVFISNAGDLFILNTKITGWSEKDNRSAAFKDKHTYRPFLVSWSGARMYIAGSAIADLGYRKGKSYGITYSSCDPCVQAHPGLARPTGTIVGSTFSGMYYGFYSYEADDVAIVGNTYRNNAVYAIDPHDRSRRLIIANNETSGSGKKHGIIISRNVNDSWIFNNYTHHNRGSGIMIDRSSVNNVIAGNVSAYNEGDGLTFFESQNNAVWHNKIYQNKLSGIRIRNSWNIRLADDWVFDNGKVPVIVYSNKLEESQKDRDFKQDPYTKKAAADISGMILKTADRKPSLKLDGADQVSLSDMHLLSGGTVFSNLLFLDEDGISKSMAAPQARVVVAKRK